MSSTVNAFLIKCLKTNSTKHNIVQKKHPEKQKNVLQFKEFYKKNRIDQLQHKYKFAFYLEHVAGRLLFIKRWAILNSVTGVVICIEI